MASKIFFSHQKVYFWISAFDHKAIVLDKMHIVQCNGFYTFSAANWCKEYFFI